MFIYKGTILNLICINPKKLFLPLQNIKKEILFYFFLSFLTVYLPLAIGDGVGSDPFLQVLFPKFNSNPFSSVGPPLFSHWTLILLPLLAITHIISEIILQLITKKNFKNFSSLLYLNASILPLLISLSLTFMWMDFYFLIVIFFIYYQYCRMQNATRVHDANAQLALLAVLISSIPSCFLLFS